MLTDSSWGLDVGGEEEEEEGGSSCVARITLPEEMRMVVCAVKTV